MANPLDAFKGLKGWQKGAVIGGGALVVVGIVYYEKKSKASAATAGAPAAAAPAATSVTASDMVTDPTTGQTYPAQSVDPASGLTYATEIQEYGSVAMADEQATQAGDAAIQEGLTQTEYDQETGQPYDGSGTPATAVTTNAQWMAEVETGLSQQGYSASDIGQGIAGYFAGKPLGTTSDGTSLYTMMNLAIEEWGPPPTGSYALLNGNGSSSLPGTGNAVVPDVVGRTDLATAEGIIKQAGLVPHAAGDSGTGNKGSVTSQSPAAGSTVSKGSSVTLTYTISAANEATVPSVIGRRDLATAKGILTAAGFRVVANGGSGAGNKGKITSQSPKAGSKAAKGSTVTIFYSGGPPK